MTQPPLLVIPTRPSTTNDHLRWTLRAWERAHPDANILLIGGLPTWYTGQHLATTQHPGNQAVWQTNIPRAIDAALWYANKNGYTKFWWVHDDTLPLGSGLDLQHPVTWARLSPFSRYVEKTKSRRAAGYTGTFEEGMRGQYRILRELGVRTDHNADCHMPHLLRMNQLTWLMDLLKARYPQHPRGQFRAIYGGLWPGQRVERRRDPKLLHRIDRISPDADWVSLATSSWAGYAGRQVRDMFTAPSSRERR